MHGDEEKSGTIRPAKDEEFTGSSFFWALRSSPRLAGIFLIKSFDRTLLLETLNFMMLYQRAAVIWWKLTGSWVLGFSKGLTTFHPSALSDNRSYAKGLSCWCYWLHLEAFEFCPNSTSFSGRAGDFSNLHSPVYPVLPARLIFPSHEDWISTSRWCNSRNP
jgi:hypothetical protein